MKKIPDYKIAKWEKRKAILVENSKWDYNELKTCESTYQKGTVDETRYHYTLSLIYAQIAEDEFVQENYKKFFQNVSCVLNEFCIAVKLFNKGNPTNQATKARIENKIKSGYFAYYALLLSRHDIIADISEKDSSITQMLSCKTVCDDDNPVNAMMNAISLRDSEKFENALIDRITAIRKFNLDNYICADFISMGLIAEAKRSGLHFYSNYIEVDCKDL